MATVRGAMASRGAGAPRRAGTTFANVPGGMATALLTTYLAPYRVPLFERLAKTLDVEVLCFGGGERYVPPWFTDLDTQLANAPFPARRLSGASAAFMT